MADSDIFVSNDISMDVNFGEVFVIDQGVVYKVIASKYSNTATYVVGAYVLHLEKLYRCITAVEEPEEFDSEKWTQVLLANEVQIANANIALKANADDVYDKTAIDGKVSDINAAIALKANSADVYAKTETYNQTEVDNALATKADADTTYSKTEVDDALALKADAATTYNKTEVDNALAAKADAATTYTKTEVDTALSTKADSSSVYSKSDTDTLLAAKADVATTYTKTEVDNALANKANSADVYAKTETYSKTEIDTNIYTKTETYNKTEVDGLINNLPTPMQFKGTLGTGGTITDLPAASISNNGFTYKVITDGTYASIPAKVGDMFTSNGNEWVHIPSGDETFTDTWRGIKVNGTEKLGSSINTGSVDFKNGTNSTVVFDSSDSSIKVDVDGYTQAQVDTKLSAKANSADVYAKSETYSASEVDTKLLAKANSSDVYTQAEVDTKLSGKANTSDVYTQAQIDTKLADKADKSTTYTKTEVDNALSAKANTTDVNTALDLKADKSDTYTKEEVDDKVDVSDTASGAVASFDDGSGLPFQEIKCEINAIQEGTPWIDSNVIEKEPYNFRKVAGTASRIGNHLFDKLVGGTVAWNQLVNPRTTPTTSYQVTFTFTSDGKCSMSGTASGGTAVATIFNNFSALYGHKYLILGGLNENIYLVITNVTVWGSSNRFDTGNGTIVSANASGQVALNAQVSDGTNASGKVMSPMFIDLTAMFGSTIADYIYSLEQATAGAGVAWFRKLFPDSYYTYNAGELISVKTTAHKLTGKNLAYRTIRAYTGGVAPYTVAIDNDSESVIFFATKGETYTVSSSVTMNRSAIVQISSPNPENHEPCLQAGTVTTNTWVAEWTGWTMWYKVSTVNLDFEASAQVELGSTATAYEPYTEHNYALDDVELRGLFKLDSNNKLYADGDTYESSGDVGRRYNIVHLGSLNWNKITSGNQWRFDAYAGIEDAKNDTQNFIISKGYIYGNLAGANYVDKRAMIYGSQNFLLMTDFAYSTAEDFKTAMNGVYMVYEKATPTTETADPFTNPQQVDANGTEEYIDSRTPAIPVGHETYYADIYDITGFTSCKVSVADGQGVERKSATIQFGQTVYGGYLEFKNGQWSFIGTHGFSSLSSGWFWAKSGSYAGSFYAEVTNVGAKANTPFICTHARSVASLSDYTNGCCYCDGSINIRIMTADTTLQQWKDFIDEQAQANKPICICYELATPFTLTLTGAQLETLLGENRVSHNCNGDTEVKYIRQTDLLDSIEFVHTQLSPVLLSATLTAGSSSITISDSHIKSDSLLDIWTDPTIYYTDITVTNGSVTINTFPTMPTDTLVKVRVN